MALIKSGTIGSGSPLLAYELHAEQTGASGNKRTVKITGKFKVNGSSASWYGYACNWRARVHNSYGSWTAIKGTESWNGGQAYRSFSQTLTVDVGTTNSVAITVGLYTDSQIDTGWDGNATGSFTVGSTNVAPVISGTVTTSPSGTIAENTGTITVTAPTATDANSNLSGYRCRVSINGGGYTEIYRGSSKSCTHNVSGYGEGTTFKYAFDAYDSVGAWSGVVYSAVVTKNKFTGDTLSSSSSIAYSTASIAFAYSGASNTNGNTTFTRTLSCDGVTVYNPTVSGSSATVTIYKSGTAPTTPYIKFNDIKNKFSSASYKGTLTFTLTTKNAYSNSRTSSKSISVNLQTTPNAVSSCSIATDANSTAYKTVTSTGNKYFIPDGSNVIRVNWGAGSGKLGEAISYELYVAYGSGSWSKVATIASGTLYYNHVPPKQTGSQTIKYRVRTKTGYGTYADKDTSAQTLHYYNPPSLTQGTITRGATTADAQVTIKSLSSIPNINTVGTWNCYNKGTTTSVCNGTLTVAQTAQTIKTTGLTDSGQYDLKVTFKDDTGFSANTTVTVSIGANSPLFFVNKYGVGVNGLKATSALALNVKGSVGIQDATGTYKNGGIFTYTGDANGMGMAIQSGGSMVIGAGESPKAMYDSAGISKTTESLYLTADSGVYFASNCNTIADRKMGVYTTGGNFHIPGAYYESSNAGTGGTTYTRVYSPNNKPKPADIGAMADGGSYGTIKLSNWIRTTGSTGWINDTYGGGWMMQDTTWIRSHGDKQVYINKLLRTDGGFQVGSGGSLFNVSTAGNATSAGDINAGGSLRLSSSPSSYSRLGYEASSGDTFVANGVNNWLRLKTNKTMTYAGYEVFTSLDKGNIPDKATLITNLNSQLKSGWYSINPSTSGRPSGVDYGVVLQMRWYNGADFYQILLSSNNARIYTRGYINGGYTGWNEK